MNARMPAGRHGAEQPDDPRAALLGDVDAPEAAHQHHPLEADVDDAGALREEPAERAERERRGVLERADEEPGRDDRGDRRGSACARGRRAARRRRTRPAPICVRRVMRAPTPAGGAAAAGGDGPAVVGGSSARSRLARATSQRTISSPPTSRMIVPWMMLDTPLASSGLNEPESCRPPLCSAANRSAESTTPMAVLRPSSATAMPVKPMSSTGTSEDGDRVAHAEHLDRAGQAGERPADRHRGDHRALDRDAAVARRLGIEADRAHLVAERRAVEDHVVDDGAGRAR